MKLAFENRRKISLILLLLIVLLGASLRLQVISNTVVDSPIRADAADYYLGAYHLQHWGVYSHSRVLDKVPAPSALRTPGVSFMLLPFFEFPPTDQMLLSFNTLQTLLSVITIVLAYLLFLSLAGEASALGAALLTAISPHLINMNVYLLSETQFTFLLLAGLTALAHGLRQEDRVWAICGGLLLGASVLSRPTTEWLPLFLAPFLFRALGKHAFVKTALPALVCALVIIWSWKIRNLLAIGAFSDPTLFMNTILHGSYPDFMFNGLPESKGLPYRFDPFAAQAYTTVDVLREVARRAGESPWVYAKWYLFGKLYYLLSWNIIAGMGSFFVYPVTESPYFTSPLLQLTAEITYWLHAPLTLAALAGGILALFRPQFFSLESKNRAVVIFLAAFLLYYFAVHIVGAPFPRYGIPLRPLIYGFGLWTIVTGLKQGKHSVAAYCAKTASGKQT